MAYATGRCMCHAHQRIPFEADDVVAMVRKVFDGRVVFHDGDDQLAPGLTVHHIGGHSMGLQCVRVKTRRGHVVLAADATHLYAHINEGRVFPITYSVAETLEGYATIKRLADSPDHIVPGHDPEVLKRYPAARARPRRLDRESGSVGRTLRTRVLGVQIPGAGGVVEDACVRSQKHRIELAGCRHEQTVERVGERVRGMGRHRSRWRVSSASRTPAASNESCSH